MKLFHFRLKGKPGDIYRANAYSLRCMAVSLGVLFFAWVLDLLGIFIVDMAIMNIAMGAAAGIMVIALVYSFIAGIDTPVSQYVVMFLFIAMASVICMELSYHTSMFMLFPLIYSVLYFDKKLSIFAAVMSCIGCAVAVMLGYRIGLSDANMMLLTYTNSAFHSAALLAGNISINTDQSLIFLFFVFPKWVFILTLMPILSHVANDIRNRTERESVARHQAETDGLTGIYNRNKYLQDSLNHYSTSEKLAVLFFDVNNLKQTNDSMGHEYGDILICGLADILHSKDAADCRSYRIGGDEFVMILTGEKADQAEEILQNMQEEIRNAKLEHELCLSTAAGLAVGAGKNVEKLVKEADEKMYQHKTSLKTGKA